MQENRELITTSTFARVVGKSESAIRLWDRRGLITAVARTPTGVRLYDRADADRLLKKAGVGGR